MQTIKAQLPKTTGDYFVYAAPAPSSQDVNKFDLAASNEIIEFETGKEIIKAQRHDFYETPFRFLGDFICKLAYGMSESEMKTWLKQRFPKINNDSMIAFYLFKKVEAITKEPITSGIGLPE